jgi:hypothetical protein
MRVKYLAVKHHGIIEKFPNFHSSGSVSGMKKLYYGEDALLVRCGEFIYNVSSDPSIYFNLAK